MLLPIGSVLGDALKSKLAMAAVRGLCTYTSTLQLRSSMRIGFADEVEATVACCWVPALHALTKALRRCVVAMVPSWVLCTTGATFAVFDRVDLDTVDISCSFVGGRPSSVAAFRVCAMIRLAMRENQLN